MNQKLLGILTASFLIGAFLVSVSASFLQRSAEVALDARTVGEDVYTTYCASCHGELGDGQGPAAYALAAEGNEVTNFIPEVSGEEGDKTFQYGLNAAGVPTDESLHETIIYGRSGRAMPAFPLLSVAQREAVIAYIKTFRSGGWPSEADVAASEAATEDDQYVTDSVESDTSENMDTPTDEDQPSVDDQSTTDSATDSGNSE